MANEDFAVRGMMPEMGFGEVSPLAVQGPMTAQPDLSQIDFSQFEGLNVLPRNFSGAFGGSGSSEFTGPTGYAIPENYGNPKNKIYTLSAAPGEGVRLRAIDGTVLFEGSGPEAAAKAASIVQELGKQFGTQSTWTLDKQPVGGEWKQVSQDTVGQKKNTAINAFLNVAAPIAGAFIPGLSPVLGAALGSVANSALQNKNSAQAIKDAAIAAAGSYIGAKIAPGVSDAFKGITGGATGATPIGTAIGDAFVASSANAAEQAAAQAALAQGIQTTVVPMIAKQGLTSAIGTGLGAGVGGLVRPDFNPTLDTTVPNQDLAVNPEQTANPNIDELTVTAKPFPEPVSPFEVAGAGLSGLTNTVSNQDLAVNPDEPVTPNDAEITVTANSIPEPVSPLTAAGAGLGGLTGVTTNPIIDEIVVTAPKRPTEEPIVPTPVILPDGTLNPDFVNKDITVDNPEGKTETKTKNPLDVIKDVLPLVTAVVGGVGGAGGSGGGTGGNTLAYPTGKQPGTLGSLGSVFSAKLPTGTGSGFAVTPRNMGQRDWLRYGFGPEASFFSNVPDRQAPLAVQGPAIQSMPALSEKLSEPTTSLAVKSAAEQVPVTGSPGYEEYANARIAAMMPEERAANQAAIKASYDEAMKTGKMYSRGGSTEGSSHKPRTEFAVIGAGTGRSDEIPSLLSDGEYVMDAETVAFLGDGSNKAGAKRLDQFRVNLRRHKGANLAKGRFSVNAKSPEKYLAGGRV